MADQDEEDFERLAAEKLCGRIAEKYGVSPRGLLNTLRDTVFAVKADEAPFRATEIAAALTLCEQYDLNPLAREIFVTRNPKTKLLLVMIGVDGYIKIANRDPNYDGCEFESEMGEDGKATSITCRVYVRNRTHPATATEYMKECCRNLSVPTPWQTHPNRMLRHKAFIQAVRIAFGLAGIADEDEIQGMVDLAGVSEVHRAEPKYLAEPNDLQRVPEQAKRGRGRMKAASEASPETLEKNKALKAELDKRMASETVEPGTWDEPEPAKPQGETAEQEFGRLWKRWVELRGKISDAGKAAARQAGGVEAIGASTPLEAMRAIVAKGEEYL